MSPPHNPPLSAGEAAGQSAADPATRRECWWVALFIAAFLAFNLATATRYPFVWEDEACLSDPGVNLYEGHGYISTSWGQQPTGEFWIVNVPLHQYLLFLWLKIFGFSITAVRSVNYVYFAAMLLLIWRGCLRLNLIPSPRWRLALLALLAGGYSTFFCYRCARYDGITMLVAAAIFYCWTLGRASIACAAIFLLGVISPWAGLQLLPFYGLFGLLVLCFFGKPQLPKLISAALGTAAGLGLLTALYRYEGVLDQFLLNMRHHGTTELLRDLRHGHLPGYLISKDFSFFVLFLVAAALAFNRLRQRQFKIKSFIGFGVISSVFVFAGMFLSGKFPTYYSWMVYIPLSICLCAIAARAGDDSRLRKTIGLAFATAIFVGLAPHVAVALSDWSDRDYAIVTAFVNQNTTPADCAYGEDNVYYALKWRVTNAYLGRVKDVMTPEEKSRLTVLFIRPGHLAAVTNRLGGDWVRTGATLVPGKTGLMGTDNERWGWLAIYNYALEVYRRRPDTSPDPKPKS